MVGKRAIHVVKKKKKGKERTFLPHSVQATWQACMLENRNVPLMQGKGKGIPIKTPFSIPELRKPRAAIKEYSGYKSRKQCTRPNQQSGLPVHTGERGMLVVDSARLGCRSRVPQAEPLLAPSGDANQGNMPGRASAPDNAQNL